MHNTKSSSSCRVAVAKSRQWQTNRNKIQAVNFIRTTSSTRQSKAKAMAMAKATPATLATRGATNNSHNLGPSSTSFAGFYCHSSPAAQKRWRTEEAEKVANWSRLGHRALGHLGTVFNHANCIAQLSGNYCHYIRGSESPPRCCNLYEFTQQFSFQCHRLFRQVNWTGVGLCWNGWIFWGM